MRISEMVARLKVVRAGVSGGVCMVIAGALFAWSGVAGAQTVDDELLPDDYQIFVQGFTAYKQKDYRTSQQRMARVLEQYPDTPLRDVTLFWLASSTFKCGDKNVAAGYLVQLSREYPDTLLRALAEEELNRLAISREQGEKIPIARLSAGGDAS